MNNNIDQNSVEINFIIHTELIIIYSRNRVENYIFEFEACGFIGIWNVLWNIHQRLIELEFLSLYGGILNFSCIHILVVRVFYVSLLVSLLHQILDGVSGALILCIVTLHLEPPYWIISISCTYSGAFVIAPCIVSSEISSSDTSQNPCRPPRSRSDLV